MAQEIYHRSEWGNPNEQWGNVYLNADLTNELYKRASEYENSWVTDQLLNGVGTKPSIILTPTAYEDGVLNSVKPAKTFGSELVTNGTFETDSDWIKGRGWTIANGKASFDGGSDSAIQQDGVSVSGKKYSVSIEVLDSTTGSLQLRFGSSASVDATITENGVYNYTLIADGTRVYLRSVSGFDGSIDNVSVKEVIDADFDFTRGSSATRVNEKGLIEEVGNNIPRIDYSSGEGSLKLEPQSTNLITYSEDFSQWTPTNIVLRENTVTSPNGTITADKISGTSVTSQHRVNFTSTNVSGATTFSFFAKSAEYTSCWARIGLSSAYFDLENGLTGQGSGVTSSIENFGNGWYRCIMTNASSSANEVCRINITASYLDGSGFLGDDTSGIYLWGAQLEQGSYATSYIPTTNGSTVTRLADVCNNSGNSDLINSTEGVLYAEISALADDLTFRSISINANDTRDDQVMIRYRINSNVISFFIRDGGSVTLNKNVIVQDITEYNKVALKYKNGDISGWINGVEYITSTATGIPSGLSKIGFQLEDPNVDPFFGNVKCVAVFKEALSDTELQKLTTI